MPSFGGVIRNLSGMAQYLSRAGQRLYDPPPNTIAGVNSTSWPTAGQPVAPIAPPGSNPLQIPFWFGQNLTFQPRPDAVYTAAELKALSTFPIARICIDNTKDVLGQVPWSIELRQMAGESQTEIKARRKKDSKGDSNIAKFTRFFERPSYEHDWEQWTRALLDDMLTIDAGTTFLERNKSGKVVGMRPFPGEQITVYVDDNGYQPRPPSPAYAQLYMGTPRTDLTADQIVYRPRNYVHRVGVISSYLYGYSCVESVAELIKIGAARMNYVLAYYAEGAVGNLIQVVPPRVGPDKILEAQQSFNSDLTGNFGRRRQLRLLQGFLDDGKDQVVQPKEPTLADNFDDYLSRVLAFAFGTSSQRLQRAMNRGSATSGQAAANEEGIKPFLNWLRCYCNYILQEKMGARDYELVFQPYIEDDYGKKARADVMYVDSGIRTRKAVADEIGDDPPENADWWDVLTVKTANGVVELGDVVTSNAQVSSEPAGGGDGGKPKAAPGKVRRVARGER